MTEEEERTIFCSSFILKPNKIFTYKGEEYNVDFTIIKRNCKYFEKQKSEIKQIKKYEMNEVEDLPPETIQTFLSCSQNQRTTINDFVGVNYLSIKYENDELRSFTERYIENHYNDHIFQLISFKQHIQEINDTEFNIDTSNEEKVLSSHFLEYLDDERIFSLNLNTLDRVMKRFMNENKEVINDEMTMKKINGFLLKCLTKYNKRASVLFLNINFEKLDRDLIVNLHELNDKFDFNMINTKSLFNSTYDLIGEIAQIKSQLNVLMDEKMSCKNEFEEYKKLIKEEMDQIRDDLKRMSKKQSETEENQTKISSKLESFETNQNELINKHQNFENKNQEYESKHQNFERKNQELENKLQNFERKNQEYEGKLQILDRKQSSFSGQIQTIETKLLNLDGKQSGFSGRLQTLENKISQQMQPSLNQISEKIQKFATREIYTNELIRFQLILFM